MALSGVTCSDSDNGDTAQPQQVVQSLDPRTTVGRSDRAYGY